VAIKHLPLRLRVLQVMAKSTCFLGRQLQLEKSRPPPRSAAHRALKPCDFLPTIVRPPCLSRREADRHDWDRPLWRVTCRLRYITLHAALMMRRARHLPATAPQ
jgi:hypothetical protein